MKKLKILMIMGATSMLSSCNLSDIPGLDNHMSIADSRAVGAACRNAGRAIEDCFKLNPKAQPSGVFDGWKDMNDYMMANHLAVVKPEIETSAYQPANNNNAAPQPQADNGPVSTQRDRWMPPSLEQQANPAAPQASSGDKPHANSNSSSKSEANADDKPSRPWERKKDGKNHT